MILLVFSKNLRTNNTKMDVRTLQSTMANTHEWPEKAHRHLAKAKNPIEPNNIIIANDVKEQKKAGKEV